MAHYYRYWRAPSRQRPGRELGKVGFSKYVL
jgi:hypothetical protein